MKHNRLVRRLLPVLLALLALSAAGVVAAHPLGNFTISRYSALTLNATTVDVLYIVDMAEIPTLRERQAMDADDDGIVSATEEAIWVKRMIPELAANLRLTADGAAVPLSPLVHTLSFPPGQGGLETMRLEIALSATLPETTGERAIAYEDGNFAERLGWQEIIATTDGGALAASSVPAVDLSNQLRDYPSGLLQAPPAVDRAEMRYTATADGRPRTAEQTVAGQTATATAPNRFSRDEFANLLDRTLDTPGALLGALLVAVGLGAAHALTPGHGKSIVGAYLVGSRGKARHALFLGLTTTITHTAGVFALGFLVLAASEFILPEKLYPWLGVLSGLLVVFIGASIFRGHFRHWLSRRRGDAHDHEHYHFHFGKGHSHHDHGRADSHPPTTDHVHNHDHGPMKRGTLRTTNSAAIASTVVAPTRSLLFAGAIQPAAVSCSPTAAHDHNDHDHGHHHGRADSHPPTTDHRPPTTDHSSPAPLAWRNLLALGISGGILPCPSALILMLSAIALRQVGLGITLIVAFSIGLAGVLTAIGLVMVYAGRLLERLPIRHTAMTTRLLPMTSAAFITVAGLFITVRALGEAGVF